MNKITIINNYKKALNKLERLNYKQREEISYYLDDKYCLFNIGITNDYIFLLNTDEEDIDDIFRINNTIKAKTLEEYLITVIQKITEYINYKIK